MRKASAARRAKGSEYLGLSAVGDDPRLRAVRTYWNNHVDDWKVAKSAPGTAAFFREIEEYRFEKLHYLPKLVDFNGFSGKSLLDVGCGVGNDTSRFARGGALVTGIDLAPHSIDLAKRNFAQRKLKGTFLVMNGERMDFPSNHFDAVYCHTVLHFTPNPETMLAEIYRVLKPGGQAIVMTVNRRSWLMFMHTVAKVEIDYLDAPVFNSYSIAEFRRMLGVFPRVEIVPERFPVATKIHGGAKAALFNTVFVSAFNLLPKAVIRSSGHHLIAFCGKDEPARASSGNAR
jgi:ubiquinone/menaquinone biosynthesis C-methylase UbiE